MIRFGPGRLVESVAAAAACTHCGEGFDGDGGVLLPDLSGPPNVFHRECVVRLVAGGVNHQRGTCACHGGTDPADPPSLSKREAARVARTYHRLHSEDARCPTPATPSS